MTNPVFFSADVPDEVEVTWSIQVGGVTYPVDTGSQIATADKAMAAAGIKEAVIWENGKETTRVLRIP